MVKLAAIFLLLAAINFAGIQYLQLSERRPYQVSSDGVELRALPSPQTRFARECAEKETPVVLRNSVVEMWKARTRWKPSYLESKLRMVTGIYENENRWFGPYYDTRKPLMNISVRVNPYRTNIKMSGKQFFRKLREPEEGSHLYFTGGIEQLGAWAEREVQPLQELLLLNPSKSSINVWIGQPHVIAHCHYDGYHNFYAQLHGTKRFTMFRPTNWPGLYPYPFLHPSHAQAQVNLSDPEDVRHFPLVAKAEAVEVVLEPGDLLYIPPLWFHHVESMNLSISVNVWTDSTQTEIMETVFALPLPTESVEWTDRRARAVATAVLIYSMLESVCQKQTCVSVYTDSFLEQPAPEVTDKQLYFVHRLWSTRYGRLMEKGELPIDYTGGVGGRETVILCENEREEGRLLAQEAVAELTVAQLEEFSETVGRLVGELSRDTWELWVGNYVEYIAASAVDVEYVGVFLREFASCVDFMRTKLLQRLCNAPGLH